MLGFVEQPSLRNILWQREDDKCAGCVLKYENVISRTNGQNWARASFMIQLTEMKTVLWLLRPHDDPHTHVNQSSCLFLNWPLQGKPNEALAIYETETRREKVFSFFSTTSYMSYVMINLTSILPDLFENMEITISLSVYRSALMIQQLGPYAELPVYLLSPTKYESFSFWDNPFYVVCFDEECE